MHDLKERDRETSANGADSTNDKAIDPGVLAILEIVFDNSHHFALLIHLPFFVVRTVTREQFLFWKK